MKKLLFLTGAFALASTALATTRESVVEPRKGYNSWPMIEAIGDRLIAVYRMGHAHNPGEKGCGTFARVSNDGGLTWGARRTVTNDPQCGETAIAKGRDSSGAALFWVRSYGPKPFFSLYRTTDGERFDLISQPKLDKGPWMQITDVFAVPKVGLMSFWFGGSYADDDRPRRWGVATSADNGTNWNFRVIGQNMKCALWPTEPSGVYLGNGRILAIARTERGGRQLQLTSTDYGQTWRVDETNIRDVSASTPSLIYDPKTDLVSNYYYQRGKAILRCRRTMATEIFDHPMNWPESTALVNDKGLSQWDTGNANATKIGERHFVAWYRGNAPDCEIVVLPIDLRAAKPRTFCNPMSVPDMPIGHECWQHKHGDEVKTNEWPKWAYGCWQYEENGVKKIRQFRELADPEVRVEGKRWYLYPSCGAFWTSDDFGGTWQHVKLQEHSPYAPTIAKFRNKYYLVYSHRPLQVSDSPTGPFKTLGRFDYNSFIGDERPAGFGDPALFVEGDHLYLYWGCVDPTLALWGCELDPDNPLKAKTPARRMVTLDKKKYPWMNGPVEGAFLFKRGDTYYFTHAGGSPDGYCFFVWHGKSPLGPFTPQPTHQPVFATNAKLGLVTETGHGSVYCDCNGDWWINYCIWSRTRKFHSFERFIGQDRISFDAAGNMCVASATCEPQWLPTTGRRGPTGWKKLKAATPFAKAADDDLRTFATFGENSRTMEFTFDGEKSLFAYRVIWCDLGLDINRGVVPGPYRYRIDRRVAGEWVTWVDASGNTTDLTCDYREAPEARGDAVRLTVLEGPKGITPAITEFTVFGQP